MAGEGYTPSDVQRMSKEEVYDHLVKPGSECTLQALLGSQGVAIVSWEIIETNGSAHALDTAREMTRSRAETLIKEKARPRMNILH